MIEQKFTLTDAGGLHARPAALFVQLCKSFQCEVTIRLGEKQADAKSILSLMTLGAGNGVTITVCADGSDEVQAMEKITGFFSEKSH